MTQIILLNGPRGVGKDTAALAMSKYNPQWAVLSIMGGEKRQALFEAGVDPDMMPVYEQFKDAPFPEFGDRSFREMFIEYANAKRAVYAKHFVRAWVEQMEMTFGSSLQVQHADVVVVPDVRFFEEFAAAVDLVGGRNVYLMRILRPGHDFTGDVGGYIRTDMAVFGNAEVTIQNDQDEEFFKLETAVFARGFVARARDKKP